MRKNITNKLLLAVANGMESRAVNIDPQPNDLFAEDLLRESPESMLKKRAFTDWGGREFKPISAFQYAVWARDFKMIEMMLTCVYTILDKDWQRAEKIRAELIEQCEQVITPVSAGGGLTYKLAYNRLALGDNIPIPNGMGGWLMTAIEEVHTENYFDLNPLVNAYQDYVTHFNTRTLRQNRVCWVREIGTLQRLLPVHMLQRYCDPYTPFCHLQSATFTGPFKRTVQFHNVDHGPMESLLFASWSSDFALSRSNRVGHGWWAFDCSPGLVGIDLLAIRRLDAVSTHMMEVITRGFGLSSQSHTQFRP